MHTTLPPKNVKSVVRSPSDSLQDAANTTGQFDELLVDKFDHMLNRMTKSMLEAFNSCVNQIAKSIEEKFTIKPESQAT